MLVELSRHEEYRGLSAREKDAILRHDVRNLLSGPVLGLSLLAEEGLITKTRIPKIEELGIDQMFDLHRRLLDKLTGVKYRGPSNEIHNLIDSAPTRRELEKVIRESVDYLDNPDDNHRYDKLRAREIPLNLLPQALLVDAVPRCSLMVNGATTVILFNEINNARMHSRTYGDGYEPVEVRVLRRGVVVENYSRDPLPDDPFGLGVTGNEDTKGHGYGLFIAAMYAEREGIRIIPSCQPAEEGSRVRFTNQFTQLVA